MALRSYLLSVLLSCIPSIFLNVSPAAAIDIYGGVSYWEVEDADGVTGAVVGGSLPVFTDFVRLDGRVNFFENSDLDDDDELELLPIDLGVQIHILPDARFDPYVLGGISYVYADADEIDVDSDFGGYLGGGVQFKMVEHFSLFGELLYRAATLESDRGARNEDVEVNGASANVGLKFSFL